MSLLPCYPPWFGLGTYSTSFQTRSPTRAKYFIRSLPASYRGSQAGVYSCRVRKAIAHAQRSVTLLSPICGCAEPSLGRGSIHQTGRRISAACPHSCLSHGREDSPLGRARAFPLAVLRRVHIHCERSVRVLREVVVAAEGIPFDRIGDGVFRHSVTHRHGKAEADTRGRQLSS
jgi:hypothetical protein